MTTTKRSFWLSLSLVNLCIVALFGFTLRSKILFSLPFIDYRNFLSAHSHFAFGGWIGLSLITLLIYDVLPAEFSQKKIYQYTLAGIEASCLGMAVLFPIQGYSVLSIIFSSLYILISFVFVWEFVKDVLVALLPKTIKLLGISAIISFVLSMLGPLALVYIIISKSGNSILYRDSIYTFLHFQYNGFFTLSVFAVFFSFFLKKQIILPRNTHWFSLFLCLSIVPSLFLALLWHNKLLFYVFGVLGCLLILASLFYFIKSIISISKNQLFRFSLSHTLWIFSAFSFVLKMLLAVGTIFPKLGNAVYGDRPVIIGFLHLVFLGFVTFYILSNLIESGYFIRKEKLIVFPFIVFSSGIISNEIVLMLQGFGILLQTNNDIYKWLLWGASILLFTGALLLTFSRFRIILQNKRGRLKKL